jgi:transcriptional regulator with XRE-family HTH domain
MVSRRAGIAHYNTLRPAAPVVDTKSLKAEFARRLQAAMIRRGWNQSELARRASQYLPKPVPGQKRGKAIGRDLVSHWVRGQMLPGPANLEATARALGVQPADLMPMGAPSVAHSDIVPMELRQQTDGRTYIRLNRTVSNETAMKIMGLLNTEDQTRGDN